MLEMRPRFYKIVSHIFMWFYKYVDMIKADKIN